MPDLIFENPKLAAIYDDFDGQRDDLGPYLAIAKELKARSVLDVGCGTGSFASLLCGQGFDVVGVDPAQASLDIARTKPHADKITWIWGSTADLPDLNVDLAVMTGNVAQVFLSDEDWLENLKSIRKVLNAGGHLVFEARNPEKKAWLNWTLERTRQRLNVPGIGFVEGSCNVTHVSDELIGFRWTYIFESDGSVLSSDSMLRFRSKAALEQSLEEAGYVVEDIRDAPDRPGQEFVFITGVKN